MDNPKKRAGVDSSGYCNDQETIEQKYDTNRGVKVILIGEKNGDNSLESLLRMLKIIREVNNEKRIYNHGGGNERERLVVELDVKDRKGTKEYPQMVPIKDEHKTKDGLKLILEKNSDGTIKAHLEEDLELTEGRNNLENLVNLLKTITTVENVDERYIPGTNGDGEKRLEVKLKISGIKEFEGLEKELLKQIKLYRNLQEALRERMGEIQKLPQGVWNDIEFYTHLGIEEKYQKGIKLVELADFLRELYGIVKTKSKSENYKGGITEGQILSELKNEEIVKQRSIMMYIIYNKFDFLSSVNIGKIFGEIGKPKNHATVLLAIRKFKEEGFNPEFYKKGEAQELYKDAERRYIKPRRYK